MTTPIKVGETKMLAISFENVSNAQPIPVKDLVKAANGFVGSTSAGVAADQIWTYTQGDGWKKYYYCYSKRSGYDFWAAENTTTEIGDDIVIPAGVGFFFVRASTGSTDCTLTFKGPDAK